MTDHAARMWQTRARAEVDAAGRFRRIASGLEACAADGAVIDLARSAARDEIRHFELCSSLVEHFGHEPIAVDKSESPPLRSGANSTRAQLLYEVVAMSCVTESLSTALLMEIRDQATDAKVRDVAHEVLRDEVRHARLGWAHLASEHGRIDVAFLAPRLPAMLAQTVATELFEDDPTDHGRGVVGRGGLRRSDARRIFLATMHEVVLPGLTRFGVDTGAAESWLSAR